MSADVGIDLHGSVKKLLSIELRPAQIQAFDCFAEELMRWNQRMSLTAITEPAEIAVKHFLDSLTCLLAFPFGKGNRVADIGSGAGCPGIPLKIACPQLDLVLVESSEKKVRFLEHIIRTLNLEGVEVLAARAETVGQAPEHRERYDWVFSRAVAQMPVLVEYMLPLVRIGGWAVAQKGEVGPAESHTAENALRLLGGHLGQILPVELPGVAESRYLVLIEKVARTPDQFPRRTGVPAKRPL